MRCGTLEVRGLRAGLVLRALVDDLAVVHVQLARVHGLSTRDRLHMEVVTPWRLANAKAKRFRSSGVISSSTSIA